MSIATLTHPSLMAPLQNLFRWFASGTTSVRRARPVENAPAIVNADATSFVATFPGSTRTIKVNRVSRSLVGSAAHGLPTDRPMARTLRVSRLVEKGQATPGEGRMVISGRMKDVCAELDRLAEMTHPSGRETTLH